MPKTYDVRRNQIEEAKKNNTLFAIWAFTDKFIYWGERDISTPPRECFECGVESYFVEYEDDEGNTYTAEEVED